MGKDCKSLETKAENGDVTAQIELGHMYLNGEKDVTPDFKEAFKWYRKAAEQEDAEGQYCLGYMYQCVDGWWQPSRREIDYDEAMKWYLKAADQGYAPSQLFLGWMYKNGDGVPKGNKEAFNWIRKAAAEEYYSAQLELGKMYANGRGVEKDEKEAIKWFNKAAWQGYIDFGVYHYNEAAAELEKLSNK